MVVEVSVPFFLYVVKLKLLRNFVQVQKKLSIVPFIQFKKMNCAEAKFVAYMFGSAAYGFARKVCHMSNAPPVHGKYDADTRTFTRVPMLLVDKVVVVGLSTLIAPILLPLNIYNDVKWLEIKLSGINPADHTVFDADYRMSIDYLFC